jgi:glycine/D-amino acid oxidase-like deaminating enzyme
MFPITDASPVRHNAPLPKRVDVAVIGGGIIGVMTAWFLRKRGLSVLVLEKGRIAGEQSSRNWGWVRQQGRDLAELPIMIESLGLWQDLATTLGDGLGFRQSGALYMARTDREMAAFEAWLTSARDYGLDTRLLTGGETAAMLNGAVARWKGGLWTPSDARAEPWTAVPLLADAAAASGVVIREACAVRALDIAAGRICGVVTEAGRVACDKVVVAAGAWSRLLLQRHGIYLPQLSVRGTVAETEPMPEIFSGCAADDHIGIRRRADGGYSIASGGNEDDFFIGPDAFRSFFAYVPILRQDPRLSRFRLAAPKGFPDAWDNPRRWAEDQVSPVQGARRLCRRFPILGSPEAAHGLGRDDRHAARCGAGGGSWPDSRPDSCHGDERAWFWHRTRHGQGGCRPGNRGGHRSRSDPLPVCPIFRWQQTGSGTGALIPLAV